jgi:hypothetical protein
MFLSSFLWTGVTFASFHLFGKCLVVRLMLKIAHNGLEIISYATCSSLAWIASGPDALLVLRSLSTSWTSCCRRTIRSRHLGGGVSSAGTDLSVSSMFDWDEKKVLKASAFSASS